MRYLKDIYTPYKTRLERTKFSIEKLLPINNDDTILSVGGGGENYLSTILDNFNIKAQGVEIDIAGNPDYKINLEKIDKLPFKNNEFSFLILNDIIEHIENFHLVLNESFRIAKKKLIISLPIPSNDFVLIIKSKKYNPPLKDGGLYNKFYGLPHETPIDRHKWWFTHEDALAFFDNYEKINNCEISTFTDFFKPAGIQNKLAKLFLSKRLYKNFFHNAVWFIIEK